MAAPQDAGAGVRPATRQRLSRITTSARALDHARLKPIVLLALVVGLQSADGGTVGALVVSLKRSLHINDIQVGLLVTVSTGVGALATLVAGALADRTARVRLLWMALLVCSAAMALSAAAPSYGWLLASRVGLGAGMAVSGPVVASLVGDYFRPGERGRVYGLVLAGEGTCTAVGLLVAGNSARSAGGWASAGWPWWGSRWPSPWRRCSANHCAGARAALATALPTCHPSRIRGFVMMTMRSVAPCGQTSAGCSRSVPMSF